VSERDNVIHVAFGEGGGRIANAAAPPKQQPAGMEPVRAPEERDDPLADLYSAADVARLFGVHPSRLRYWDRTEFLSPSGRRGRRRYYTFQDLIGLRAAKSLLDEGVPLQRVRRTLESLRALLPKVTRPLNELRVTTTGSGSGAGVVVRDARGSFDPQTGQGMLDFEVSALRDDVVRTLKRHGTSDVQRKGAYELYLEGCRLDEDESTFERAEELYRKAIALDPTLANAYTNLGNVRFRRGFPEEAEVLYKQALSVDEDQPEAFYNLGFLQYERGDAKSAVTCFERAVTIDPAFADAHFNLAMALEEAGDTARARRHWQTYLQIEPDGAWAEVARRHLKRKK
jgi:tetratricopeptide (TPR) repeat protein